MTGNQSAFIPDMHVGDNILIAYECMTKVMCSKLSKAIWPKLTIEWYEITLERWDFQNHGVTLSHAIMINGMAWENFTASNGLRQGDPSSPYHFILGLVIRCVLFLQLHLCYNLCSGDDVYKANIDEITFLKSILARFSTAAGSGIRGRGERIQKKK